MAKSTTSVAVRRRRTRAAAATNHSVPATAKVRRPRNRVVKTVPEIEDHIPVPTDALPRGRKSMYPFAEMESGESFLISYVGTPLRTYRAVYAAMHNFRKASEDGADFVVRDRPEEGGVRCWRIA